MPGRVGSLHHEGLGVLSICKGGLRQKPRPTALTLLPSVSVNLGASLCSLSPSIDRPGRPWVCACPSFRGQQALTTGWCPGQAAFLPSGKVSRGNRAGSPARVRSPGEETRDVFPWGLMWQRGGSLHPSAATPALSEEPRGRY